MFVAKQQLKPLIRLFPVKVKVKVKVNNRGDQGTAGAAIGARLLRLPLLVMMALRFEIPPPPLLKHPSQKGLGLL